VIVFFLGLFERQRLQQWPPNRIITKRKYS
jgi:hypothetical protein